MKAKYLNPYTDFGCKKIFGEEASKPLQINFMNALLPEQHKIADLTFKNTEQLGLTDLDRKAIYDIYCENEKAERFIVELQKAKQNYFKDRTIYYSTSTKYYSSFSLLPLEKVWYVHNLQYKMNFFTSCRFLRANRSHPLSAFSFFGMAWLMSIVLLALSCRATKSSGSGSKDGYQLVFDGTTLDGWVYDPVYWRVEDSVLVGEVTPATILKRNTFIYKKDFLTKDFDLKVEYRITSGGNSGINYRSQLIDSLPYAMIGYQADIDGQNRYTGQNYEERRRTTLAYRGQKVLVNTAAGSETLKDHIKNNAWTQTTVTGSLGSVDSLKGYIRNGAWNEYHLIIKGNRLLHYINGILMSDVTDNDTVNRQFSGLLGVQVHVGPPMKVEYRNFRIKKL